MTGRFVAILIGACVAAYLAATSWYWFAFVLGLFVLAGIRFDQVQMRKHRRQMMRREHLEPTEGRRR